MNAASQISRMPSQSGSQPLLVAKVKPVRKRSESPGKKDVKIKAVSKKIMNATAIAAQSPKLLMISWASSQFKLLRSQGADLHHGILYYRQSLAFFIEPEPSGLFLTGASQDGPVWKLIPSA